MNVPETDGVPEIVTVEEAKVRFTPVGSPETVAPVAPVVLKVIALILVLIHLVWSLVPAPEDSVIVLFGFTVMVPEVVTGIIPHPPVKVTVYGNVPETVGVPEIVTTLAAQFPVTPAGKPRNRAPVALVVVKVIELITVFIHLVWLLVPTPDDKVIVLFALIEIVPVAVLLPQPPVKVIVYGKVPEAIDVPEIVTELDA